MNVRHDLKAARDDAAAKAATVAGFDARIKAAELEATRIRMETPGTSRAIDAAAAVTPLRREREQAANLLGMAQARLKQAERRVLVECFDIELKRYAELAKAVTQQLALLAAIDERSGVPARCIGLPGFRLPAYHDQRADDSGALYAFLSVLDMRADAARRLDALLGQDEQQPGEITSKELQHEPL